MPVARLRRLATLVAALLFVVLGTACVGGASPSGWAQPAPEGQDLIASLDDGTVSSLQLSGDTTGTARWTFPSDSREDQKDLDPEAVYATPTFDRDRVYVATYGEGIFALNRSDGSTAWHRSDLTGPVVNGMAPVSGGRLAIATEQGRLYLVNQADGRDVAEGEWAAGGRNLGEPIWASIAADGEAVYVATLRGNLYAFDLATGKMRWTAPFHAEAAIPDLALLPGGRLFVPSLDRRVHIVDAATGSAVASAVETKQWVWMRPAVDGNSALFGDLGGNAYSIDITTVQVRWTVSVGAKLKGAPVVLGGVVVLGDGDSKVHFLKTADGSRLNSVALDAGGVVAPLTALSDTAVLVLTEKGDLFRANPQEYSVLPIALSGALP